MNKEETAKVLAILSSAYNTTADDVKISTWQMMFANEHIDDVTAAVMFFIENDEKGYMPSVAQIKQTIRRLFGAGSKIDQHELYKTIERAVSNSTYNSVEEYNALPPLAQRIVGSPSAMREYGRMKFEDFQRDIMRGIKDACADADLDIPQPVQRYVEVRDNGRKQIQKFQD